MGKSVVQNALCSRSQAMTSLSTILPAASAGGKGTFTCTLCFCTYPCGADAVVLLFTVCFCAYSALLEFVDACLHVRCTACVWIYGGILESVCRERV